MRTLRAGLALATTLTLVGCGSRPGRAPAADETASAATSAADTAGAPTASSSPGETTTVATTSTTAALGIAAPPPAERPTPTAAGWSSAPVQRVRPGPPVRLTAVSTSGLEGFDRVVFEFAGHVPGFRVEPTSGPVQACGSGDPVALPGAAVLVVAFRGAAAHDDQGHVTVTERDRRPGLPALQALRLFCDFEGDVSWALALPRAARFRVTESAAPPRLTVDIAHPR